MAIGHTVALAHNLKRPPRPAESVPYDYYSEFDSPETIEAMAGALRAHGHTVHLVEADEHLPRWFLTNPVDVVLNIAEGSRGGHHRESQVPAILEALRIPFTGSSSTVLAIALNKAKTKQLLAYEGIPTPKWQLFNAVDEPVNPRLTYPLIVKPNAEGSAKGILRESVVSDEPALRHQLARVIERYGHGALAEEYIEGLELTVGVLGNDDPKALPILEIDFANCERSGEYFYSWRMKEYQGDRDLGLDPTFYCPARLDGATTERIQTIALRAHQALGCHDLSRTDIRLRRDGVPFVLEINPLPGLSPHESNFTQMTKAAGIPYPVVINHLVELALARTREASQTQEPSVRWLVASRQAP